MNDSGILQDLLELARSATRADHAVFVLQGESQTTRLQSPAGSDVEFEIEQAFEASTHTINSGNETHTVTYAPVIAPSGDAGWIGVLHHGADTDPATVGLIEQMAALLEERLDRQAELVRLDELGDQLRTNQEQLHVTRDELALLNQELEQFAYIAAHELVAPLRAVAVYAEVLESVTPTAADDAGTVGARDCVVKIRSGVQQMTRQVQSLLELSSNQLDTDATAPVEVAEIVQAALDTLAAQLNEIEATVDVGELPTVIAAPIPLQSVFANLFSNAIRYRTLDRPLHISVTSTATADGFRVEVADNGSGVADDDKARIFKMFERASTTADGSGIGLALSRKILNLFGGSIGVAPNTANGAVFWLDFPRVGSADSAG